MPITNVKNIKLPKWCELEHFDLVELSAGQTKKFARKSGKEILLVCKGECNISFENKTIKAKKETSAELTLADSCFEVSEVIAPVILVRLCGRWGAQIGSFGTFKFFKDDYPTDEKGERLELTGDPVPYKKTAKFDSHYHDFDEYWIFYEGKVRVASEGKEYTAGRGDCLITGMGHHHDIAEVYEDGRAVYFETTLEGKKRMGHLWEYENGKAEPKAERV